MTDDTERRLRESLRGADLPAAPETLRASLHQLADSPGRVSARRSRLGVAWAVPALAAVVAVVVVAGALSGGFGSLRPAVSSTSPPGAGAAAPSSTSIAPQSCRCC